MSSAIIHNVATLPRFSLEKEQIAYDNYDEFQPRQLHIFTKFHFTILRIS
jgi:hypothetical protein